MAFDGELTPIFHLQLRKAAALPGSKTFLRTWEKNPPEKVGKIKSGYKNEEKTKCLRVCVLFLSR